MEIEPGETCVLLVGVMLGSRKTQSDPQIPCLQFHMDVSSHSVGQFSDNVQPKPGGSLPPGCVALIKPLKNQIQVQPFCIFHRILKYQTISPLGNGNSSRAVNQGILYQM